MLGSWGEAVEYLREIRDILRMEVPQGRVVPVKLTLTQKVLTIDIAKRYRSAAFGFVVINDGPDDLYFGVNEVIEYRPLPEVALHSGEKFPAQYLTRSINLMSFVTGPEQGNTTNGRLWLVL
ncbi:MAG: hypothetical protein ACRD6W_08700 [Nitrososphaerales archaeon]